MKRNNCFKLYSPNQTISVTSTCDGIALDVSAFKFFPEGSVEQLRYNTIEHRFEYFSISDGWLPVGGGTSPQTLTAYYGVSSTNTLPTEEEIKQNPSYSYLSNQDIYATFNNSEPKYLWVAYPVSAPAITNYFINKFDFGALGENNTFSLPVIIGNLAFIQSNYPTQTSIVEFKN